VHAKGCKTARDYKPSATKPQTGKCGAAASGAPAGCATGLRSNSSVQESRKGHPGSRGTTRGAATAGRHGDTSALASSQALGFILRTDSLTQHAFQVRSRRLPPFAACASYAARASQETARRIQRGPHVATAHARKYRRGPECMYAQPGGSPQMLSARERPRAALHGARAQLAERALHAALDVGVAHHQHAGLVAAHQRHLWVG